jgi:hypothetical protein
MSAVRGVEARLKPAGMTNPYLPPALQLQFIQIIQIDQPGLLQLWAHPVQINTEHSGAEFFPLVDLVCFSLKAGL